MNQRERFAPGKGAKDTQLKRAVAPGKQTAVQLDRTAKQQADREADMVGKGAAADKDKASETARPEAFPAPAGSTPRARHDAAEARFELIETSVAGEDVTDDPTTSVEERSTDEAKDDSVKGKMTVAGQLAATGKRKVVVDACTASAEALKKTTGAETAVAAFEDAVRAYQDAYERTYLVSTDGPVKKGVKWKAEDWRERLSDKKAARAAFERWDKKKYPYLKFVVPVSKPNEVYVGIPDYGHNEIANENALTAGIMKVDVKTMRISGLENASGGYRPGPLRNAIALSRMIDLGFVESDLAGTDVHHRPDGSYTGSKIRP